MHRRAILDPELILPSASRFLSTARVWDCKAAGRADIPSIAVLTGGFSEQELTDAGATIVFDSVEHLRSHLGDTTLRDTVS